MWKTTWAFFQKKYKKYGKSTKQKNAKGARLLRHFFEVFPYVLHFFQKWPRQFSTEFDASQTSVIWLGTKWKVLSIYQSWAIRSHMMAYCSYIVKHKTKHIIPRKSCTVLYGKNREKSKKFGKFPKMGVRRALRARRTPIFWNFPIFSGSSRLDSFFRTIL